MKVVAYGALVGAVIGALICCLIATAFALARDTPDSLRLITGAVMIVATLVGVGVAAVLNFITREIEADDGLGISVPDSESDR